MDDKSYLTDLDWKKGDKISDTSYQNCSVRKKWSGAWVKLLKFEAEDKEFAKQFICTGKGQNNFWIKILQILGLQPRISKVLLYH